jgi:hypothetical protein
MMDAIYSDEGGTLGETKEEDNTVMTFALFVG